MKTNHFTSRAVLCLFAGILAVPMAFAQGGNAPRAPVAHPATNPSCALAPTPGNAFSTVVGTSWVFQWKGVDEADVAIGNMSFISVPDPNSQSGQAGFLNVIETVNDEGSILRFLNFNGRFLIFSDCTGGTLMFNTGGTIGPIEFDFYFEKLNGDPFGAMRMVSIDSHSDPTVAAGEAQKQGPS